MAKRSNARSWRRRLGWALLACAMGFGLDARAGGLSVSKTKVRLAADGAPASLIVENLDDRPTLVQARLYQWDGQRGPIESLPPTRAAFATPPIFELAPEGRQVVRLATRPGLDFSGGERAFRLVLSEAPLSVEAGAVELALRLDLPVFATPKDAAPAPSWRIAPGERLVLANHGDAHIRIRSLTLFDRGGAPVSHFVEPATVLPGRAHFWPLGTDAEIGSIVAETEGGRIEHRL